METMQNNRDPRWPPEVDAAIALKVAEAMQYAPRLELGAASPGMAPSREELLTVSFREIVKATSLDTLLTAPPALLEQLSVLAIVNNENVKGILVQLIRVYMMLWGTPETNGYAQEVLREMEEVARTKLFKAQPLKPERLKWKPMPV